MCAGKEELVQKPCLPHVLLPVKETHPHVKDNKCLTIAFTAEINLLTDEC